MKIKKWWIAVFLTAVLVSGCGAAENTADQAKENGQQAAEDQTKAEDEQADTEDSAEESGAASDGAAGIFGSFTTVTIDGEEVTEEIFSEADLTMVNIWGTFCSPCIREMPDLGELSQEYADQGVQIVGIVSDVTEAGNATALEIIEATGADYTHMVLNEELYENFLWMVQSVPTTVFVDKEGNRVGDLVMGSKEKDAWSTIIEERLSEVLDEAK